MRKQKILALLLAMLMVIVNLGLGGGVAFAADDFTIHWCNPHALTLDQMTDGFMVDFGGIGINTITSVGLYERGTEADTLVSIPGVNSLGQKSDYAYAELSLDDAATIDKALEYVLKLESVNTTVELPFNVADAVYWLDYDHVSGKDNVLFSMVIQGSEAAQADFLGHQITYFSDADMTESIGSGKVVQIPDLDGYYATVDFEDGYDVNQATAYYYQFDPFGEGKDYALRFDNHITRNPAIALNFYGLTGETETHYELTMLAYGLPADLSANCYRLQLEKPDKTIYDIKEALTASPSAVSITVEPTIIQVDGVDFSYDTVTISLSKDIPGLVLGDWHRLYYDVSENWGWNFGFQLGEPAVPFNLHGYYPRAEIEVGAGDQHMLSLWGEGMDEVSAVGIYRVVDGVVNRDVNLIGDFTKISQGDGYYRCDYTFLSDLSKLDSYVMGIELQDGTFIEKEYVVVDETFDFDNVSVQVGESQFAVEAYLSHHPENSALIGKAVTFYSDAEKTQDIGTGTITVMHETPVMLVDLTSLVSSGQAIYYTITGLSSGDKVIKHRGELEDNALVLWAPNQPNGPIIYNHDWMAYQDSLATDRVELVYYTRNVSQSLEEFTAVDLIDKSDGDQATSVKNNDSAVVTWTPGDYMDTLTVSVDKALLVPGHDYDLKFELGDSWWGFGTYVVPRPEEFLVEDYWPKAMQPWQLDDDFRGYLDVYGTGLSDISTMTLVEVGNPDVPIASDVEMTISDSRVSFNYSVTADISLDKSYQYVLTLQDDTKVSMPITIAEEVFGINPNSFPIGKVDFLLNAWSYKGADSALIGKTIEFYDEQGLKIGLGIFKLLGDAIVIETHMDAPIAAEQIINYQVLDLDGNGAMGENGGSNGTLYVSQSTQPTVFGGDYDTFLASVGDPSGTHYLFKFLVHNIAGVLDTLGAIAFVDVDGLSDPILYEGTPSFSIADNQYAQWMTLAVPKSELQENHGYDVSFNNQLWYGQFWIEGFRVDWCNPLAISTANAQEGFTINFGGNLLGEALDVGLYQVGSDTNLVERDPLSYHGDGYYFGAQFKLKQGITVNPAFDYEVRINNGSEIESFPVNIVDISCNIGYDIPANQDQFIMDFVVNGTEVDITSFSGHGITYYDNPEHTGDPIGEGTIVELNGNLFATADLGVGGALNSGDTIFYQLADFVGPPEIGLQNEAVLKATTGVFYNTMPVVTENETTYTIDLMTNGISADLSVGCTTMQLMKGDDVILDIKALVSSTPGAVSIETKPLLDTDFTYDSLKITVPKALLTMGEYYNIFFENKDKDKLVWNPWFSLFTVKDYDTIAIDKLDVNPVMAVKVLGLNAVHWVEIQLYEKGTEADPAQNLLKEILFTKPAVFDESGIDGTMFCSFELLDGKTVDQTKEYSLRFMLNEYSFWRDFKFTEYYKPDYNNDSRTTPADLALMVLSHNKLKEEEGYDVFMDMNEDGVINLMDYVIVSKMMD